jgi:hypothetical protein
LAFLTAAAPYLGIAGATIGAVGGIQQGLSSTAEARYQAAAASNNAIIANQNAAYSI